MSTLDIPAAAALPIVEVVDQLHSALTNHRQVILEAPPGSGKTTVLPLALMNSDWLAGKKILVLEPRRLAARGAAMRMAELLGEAPGQRVGYRMRLERKTGPKTQIEVITEGMLTRQLQQDPELSGVGLIIFDEFHERSLQADLGLALCLDVQSALREDLRLLLMSATLNGARLQAFLSDAITIQGQGRSYPVTLHYLGGQPSTDRRAISERLQQTIATVLANDHHKGGNILCFLPGQAEIQECLRSLKADPKLTEFHVLPLYGALPAAQQAEVVRPSKNAAMKPRIILSTAIAESSLTLPNIRVVVDTGLSRQPRFDANSGLVGLHTRITARANADQRSGRAGRTQAGHAYRLWSEQLEQNFDAELPAEILQTELSSLRLELAQWGCQQADELRWLDLPSRGSWQGSESLLRDLGALATNGSLTTLGQAMCQLSTAPRLAAMLLKAPASLREQACDLAALLQEGDPLRQRSSTVDVSARLQGLARWRNNPREVNPEQQRSFAAIDRSAKQLKRQLSSIPSDTYSTQPALSNPSELLFYAYPDRLAMAQPGRPERLKLANGRGAQLAADEPLLGQLRHSQEQTEPGLLVVADMNSHERDGQIRLATQLPFDTLQRVAPNELQWQSGSEWDEQAERVISADKLCYRSLTLQQKIPTSIDADSVAKTLLQAIAAAARKKAASNGFDKEAAELLDWLPWDQNKAASVQLLRRLQFVRGLKRQQSDAWPDWSAERLIDRLPDWLGAFVTGISSRSALQKIDMEQALLAQLTWPQQQQLDQLAPSFWERARSGNSRNSRWKIDYPSSGPPVLAVKLQALFGISEHPSIANGEQKLLLHLLSPARRPIQVTQDLASFWENTYSEVRKELRGRYPKHDWPEDPYSVA